MFGTARKKLALRPKMSAMSTATPQMRTLARALKDCGGETALAKALGVATEDLARWLSGQAAPPASVYFRALDLVATGR
jgi:hypothetical protein